MSRAAPFPVLFAADRLYLPHMATAIASLLANNPATPFHIHIIHTDIDADSLARLTAGIPCEVTSHRIPDSAFDAMPVVGHLARSSYYRLFAADVIEAPSALYLDSDLIVLGPVDDLLATDLGAYPVAAVENPGLTPHPDLGLTAGAPYLNSGVMLLNLDEWRRRALRHTVIERIRAIPHAIQFADQCGLNAVLDGDWLPLHPRHNVMGNFWFTDPADAIATFGEAQVREALANPLVIHFTGSSKPWQLNDHHPKKHLYWHYRNQTGFRSQTPNDLSLKTILRRLVPAPLQHAIRRLRGR